MSERQVAVKAEPWPWEVHSSLWLDAKGNSCCRYAYIHRICHSMRSKFFAWAALGVMTPAGLTWIVDCCS